jgi:Bacteriophage lambda head decoration protein D
MPAAAQVFHVTRRAGAFFVTEFDSLYSREQVTIQAGQKLVAGTVLQRSLITPADTTSAKAGNVGNGVMGAVTLGASAQAGRYVLTITAAVTNAGAFSVVAPDGRSATGNVAAAFNALGVSFTLADGATDFAVGDQIYIDVTGGYQCAGMGPTTDPYGVLWDDCDATAGIVKAAAVSYGAVVNAEELVWPAGMTDDQIATAIGKFVTMRTIICRAGVPPSSNAQLTSTAVPRLGEEDAGAGDGGGAGADTTTGAAASGGGATGAPAAAAARPRHS